MAELQCMELKGVHAEVTADRFDTHDLFLSFVGLIFCEQTNSNSGCANVQEGFDVSSDCMYMAWKSARTV